MLPPATFQKLLDFAQRAGSHGVLALTRVARRAYLDSWWVPWQTQTRVNLQPCWRKCGPTVRFVVQYVGPTVGNQTELFGCIACESTNPMGPWRWWVNGATNYVIVGFPIQNYKFNYFYHYFSVCVFFWISSRFGSHPCRPAIGWRVTMEGASVGPLFLVLKHWHVSFNHHSQKMMFKILKPFK